MLPSKNLVRQIYTDCQSYGWDIQKYAIQFMESRGKSKGVHEKIIKINDSIYIVGDDKVKLKSGRIIQAKNLKVNDEFEIL